MTIIFEKKETSTTNETIVSKGIYQEKDGSFTWVTTTRSGNCKRLATARKNIGIK